MRSQFNTYTFAGAVVKDTGKRQQGKRVFIVKYRNKLVKVTANSANEAVKFIKRHWKGLLITTVVVAGSLTAELLIKNLLKGPMDEAFQNAYKRKAAADPEWAKDWNKGYEKSYEKNYEGTINRTRDTRTRSQKISDVLKSEAKLGHNIRFRKHTEYFYSPENTGFHLHLNTKGNTIQHIHEEGDKRHRHPSLPKYLGVTAPGYKNAVRGAALAKGVGTGIGISVGAIALANMVKKSYNKGVIGAYKRMSKGQNVGF